MVTGLMLRLGAPPAEGADLTTTALTSFTGANGATPYAGLTLGADGGLYGVSLYGGTGFVGGNTGYGTIFRITANGAFTNLVLFNSANGANPYGPLVQGTDGNFYGTASKGGASGLGLVYRLTTNNVFTTLVSFGGTNGSLPYSGLVQGLDGSFYGTTAYGGPGFVNGTPATGSGTVFKVTTNGTLTVLFQFSAANGTRPIAGLVQGLDGGMYGTTISGGTNGSWGTVFRVTTNGALFSSLFSFGGTNGANPYGGLLQASNGLLYGTTTYGGTGFIGAASGYGTVFQITTNGALQTLYWFSGGADGREPSWAKLIQGKEGNLYGTTYLGGTNGNGTAFQITPTGTLNSLLLFDPAGDYGIFPYGGLTLGPLGSFYGTTRDGGMNYGAVFRLDPAPVLKGMTHSETACTFSWGALLGRLYQVQYKTNLLQPNWINLGGPFPATNGTTTVIDPIGAAATRLYRVILLAP